MLGLWIQVDKDTNIPLYMQVSEAIKQIIEDGKIAPSELIPPSRQLAEQLLVSRTVVLQAYELLHAEGYLMMKRGAGTFVAPDAITHDNSVQLIEYDQQINFDRITYIPEIKDSSYLPLLEPNEDHQVEIIDFRHGIPAWGAFPIDKWKRALMDVCRKATPEILSYGSAAGSLALREEIAKLVRATRSIPVTAEHIVITAGATQALDIVSRLLLTKGEKVLIEDPTHPVLREIFSYSGAEVIPVPVDREGLCVAKFAECLANDGGNSTNQPKLIYVTPSHQFPLGETMSLARRLELLTWARQSGAMIIEDDYDSEYRYTGQKVSALAGLDTSGRVIYVGTFSKTLFPALRIGYAILPQALIEPFLAIKLITDRMTPTLEQEALASFIRNGNYAKHVYLMGKLYASRRRSLVATLQGNFGDRGHCYGDEAGLHMLIKIETKVDEAAIAERATKYGVRIYPASSYYTKDKPIHATFLLGYANLSEADIHRGIKLLALAERELDEESLVRYGSCE